MKYRVFHLNNYIRSFTSRDAALFWIIDQTKRMDNTYHYEDFEILDGSDL